MCEKRWGKRTHVNLNRLDFLILEVFSSLKNPMITMSLPGSMEGFVLFSLLLDNKTDVHTVSYFR